jgi:hypothetical protein
LVFCTGKKSGNPVLKHFYLTVHPPIVPNLNYNHPIFVCGWLIRFDFEEKQVLKISKYF